MAIFERSGLFLVYSETADGLLVVRSIVDMCMKDSILLYGFPANTRTHRFTTLNIVEIYEE